MNHFPKKAMVLGAGLGTRLRPLTETLPKPAIPVCGVTPLRYTLAMLRAAGVEEVVVNTHWRPEAIHEAVGDPASLGLTVHFSHEPEILGTGGGLKKVASHFRDETFLLVNGKLVYDADLEGAVAFHREKGALATMVLRPYPEGATYSPIEIDPEGRIRRFVGKFEWEGPLERCMFTGVHVLEPAVLDYLPPAIEVCINAYAYPRMIAADEPVYGVVDRERYFAEPSTPGRYLALVKDVLGGAVDLTRFRRGGADPFAGLDEPKPGVFVHPEAQVDEAVFEAPCRIGAGARVGAEARVGPYVSLEGAAIIEPGASLRESVVWAGARIEAGEALSGVVAVKDERVRAD